MNINSMIMNVKKIYAFCSIANIDWRLLKLQFVCSSCAIALLFSLEGMAGNREQLKRIHDRIAGVPPSAAILSNMEAAGTPLAAAFIAMNSDSFYDVTLKNMAAPWTNRAQSVFVPLNDYIATFIGIVRDDVDFRELLSGNIIYTGSSDLGLTAYSISGNEHYEEMETRGLNLQTALVSVAQSSVTGLPAAATAGVMTTRAAAKAFFIDGTNRAMFRFTLLNHFCLDLEQLKDTTRPPDRVRQDISRSPGGDSRLFLNQCVGCHSGMDPMAQAFAYYNYDRDIDADEEGEFGQLVYNATGDNRVQSKYLINSGNFIFGFITPDDSWDNYWRVGQNSSLGWDSALPGSGNGAKSMGRELAQSETFASCQVKKVFKSVCLREPTNTADIAKVEEITGSFQSNNYRLKQVFAETAVWCMGD